jgi:hypothetical protein
MILPALVIMVACDIPPGPTESAQAKSRIPANTRMIAASQWDSLHPEAQMRRLSKQIPGFGGWFFDHEGDLNVWVTDPETYGARARSVITAASQGLPPGKKQQYAIRVRRGQYDFQQLPAWRDRLEASSRALTA